MRKKKLLTDRSGSLYEHMIEDSARRLAEDMDAEVMRGLLRDGGWYEVKLDWVMTHEVSKEVDEWVANKTKGKHWNRGLVWLFEREPDATWFKLKWLG